MEAGSTNMTKKKKNDILICKYFLIFSLKKLLSYMGVGLVVVVVVMMGKPKRAKCEFLHLPFANVMTTMLCFANQMIWLYKF